MEPQELDKQLHLLLDAGMDDEFLTFCQDIALRHPVAIQYQIQAARWKECLELAMVTFSGYKKESWHNFPEGIEDALRHDMQSGKWNDIPSDENDIGRAIAYVTFLDMTQIDCFEDDTTKLYRLIGMHCYSAVALNDFFDGYSYRRMFVIAWFTYFLEQLTLPQLEKPQSPPRAS